MRTAIVSDLHLGAVSGRDVLRLPEARERFVAVLSGADRIVVLGDLLELRERPITRVLEAAAPALEALRQAAAGKELLVSAGNHDHQLAVPLLDQMRLEERDVALENRSPARGAPGLLGRLAELLERVEVTLTYPGVWLREDVFATHGHQVDVHMTVPRPEVVMAAAMRRVTLGRQPGSPADYEAILAPLSGLMNCIAQAPTSEAMVRTGGVSRSVWRILNGDGRVSRLASLAVGRLGIPAGVLALNAAGLGPFRSEITAAELRDSGLRSMSTAVERLGVRARHVLFGHTHRPWPLPDRDGDWRTPGGALLHNTGSWYHEGSLISADGPRSPYWPGSITWLEGDEPPRLENVLQDVVLDSADR